MTCVRFRSASNSTVPSRGAAFRSSANNLASLDPRLGLCAAASLPHRSALTSALAALARAPMLLARASVEEAEVDIMLDKEFQDDLDEPTVGAEVRVLSRHLQVRHAELHITSDFKASPTASFRPYSGLAHVLVSFPGSEEVHVRAPTAGRGGRGHGQLRSPPPPPLLGDVPQVDMLILMPLLLHNRCTIHSNNSGYGRFRVPL